MMAIINLDCKNLGARGYGLVSDHNIKSKFFTYTFMYLSLNSGYQFDENAAYILKDNSIVASKRQITKWDFPKIWNRYLIKNFQKLYKDILHRCSSL